MTTILTLQLDPTSQAHFESLRQQYYPANLNQIAAHVSLFHQLPAFEEIAPILESAAHRQAFTVKVTGLRSLGRGVAYTLRSDELLSMHTELAQRFDDYLTRQDRQRFQPHIVVQNKTTSEQARSLLSHLQQDFRPFEVSATGITLWNYLGGPWELAGSFDFSA